MITEAWDSLGDLAQHIIQFGAVAAAMTAIIVLYSRLMPKLKLMHSRLNWIMSDEVDHHKIIAMIENINKVGCALRCSPSSGKNIEDSLARIERSVTFQGARQQAMLHMKETPVFETNSNGHVTFVNSAYKKLFGITDPENMGWVNIIPPKHRQVLVQKWFQAVNDKRTFDEYTKLTNAEGKEVDVHIIAYVTRDETDNSVLGHHGEVTFL